MLKIRSGGLLRLHPEYRLSIYTILVVIFGLLEVTLQKLLRENGLEDVGDGYSAVGSEEDISVSAVPHFTRQTLPSEGDSVELAYLEYRRRLE
ncbi:hypothetical protein F4809DRAFT_587227 [Biscogniauxia mediterranea]|nr:hypothetical protein F4809DRAFT_587227 [Biscogniauxia mediterranea]